jgi:hypothetical protein
MKENQKLNRTINFFLFF